MGRSRRLVARLVGVVVAMALVTTVVFLLTRSSLPSQINLGVAAEHQAVAGETEVFEMSGDDRERALVLGGDARPADQLGGECGRVDGGISHSRSNSLIAVLARVCASTVLTITAQ